MNAIWTRSVRNIRSGTISICGLDQERYYGELTINMSKGK